MEAGVTEPCSLNVVITDGINVIATRYRNGCQMPPSLYYKYGSEFTCQNGRFDSTGCCNPSEVVISSAPLSGENGECVGADPGCSMYDCDTRERTDSCYDTPSPPDEGRKCQWTLIPKDNMLVCLGDPEDSSRVTSVYLKPIKLCAHISVDATPNLLKNFSTCTLRTNSSDSDSDEIVNITEVI